MTELRKVGLVAYVALVLTHFTLLREGREALSDAASGHLGPVAADKAVDLLHCPFCMSFWVALVVSRGNVFKALSLAGLASAPIALVLTVTETED